MSGRFFLDTNIFAYTFDVKAPAKAKRAAQLLRRAAGTGEGIVSYQVVQEFFNVASQTLFAADERGGSRAIFDHSVPTAVGSPLVGGHLYRSIADRGKVPVLPV